MAVERARSEAAKMLNEEQLRRLSELTGLVTKAETDPVIQHERLVKSVYGNLGIERRSLEIDRVRQVLSE